VKKYMVMRSSRQPSSVPVSRLKKLENVEYFNNLGSLVTSAARCTHEIKSRIAMAKAAFNRKTFQEQLRLKFMEELAKCYIWGMGLYGVETLTL